MVRSCTVAYSIHTGIQECHPPASCSILPSWVPVAFGIAAVMERRLDGVAVEEGSRCEIEWVEVSIAVRVLYQSKSALPRSLSNASNSVHSSMLCLVVSSDARDCS